MTGSKRLRRWTVALVVAAMAGLAACSPGTQSASDQPTPTESSTTAATQTTAPTETTPTETTPTEAPPVTGIVKGKNGWSTYTNAELGFTFRFPTETWADFGAPCPKVQEGSDWSYRPAYGVVPATVIKYGSKFWVVQKVSWQLGDRVAHTSTFKSCTKMKTTAAMLRAYETGNSDYLLNPLPITVLAATTRAEVKANVQAFFWNCPAVKVDSLDKSSDGPWLDVRYSCPGDPMFPGAMIDMRWYKAQGLFVVFDRGQSYHIYTAKQRPVDEKIIASFTLLY